MSVAAAAPGEDPQSRIRHRVANTFHFLAALARMRAQRGDDPSPVQGLTWMADTIVDLGTLERFVRDDEVDIAAYLEGMTAIWRDRYRGQNLTVKLDACPLTLSEGAAPSLVLAALELVANAAGHTYLGPEEPEIQVTIKALGGGYAMTVSDSGFSMASSTDTFGLWLARRLAQQIKGELVLSPDGSAILTFRP
jgi:two-component sensor histidine kinase